MNGVPRSILLLVVTITLSCAALLFTLNILGKGRENARKNSCRSNLQSVGVALLQYSKDFDKFPLAIRGGNKVKGWEVGQVSANNPPVGWADSLQPYIKSESLYLCPSDTAAPSGMPNRGHYTSYWFNAHLSGVTSKSLLLPAATILAGDGSDGQDTTDATYNKSALAPGWLTNRNSPAYRHGSGANYLMADGTVHWIKPDEVTGFGGRKNAFALK